MYIFVFIFEQSSFRGLVSKSLFQAGKTKMQKEFKGLCEERSLKWKKGKSAKDAAAEAERCTTSFYKFVSMLSTFRSNTKSLVKRYQIK